MISLNNIFFSKSKTSLTDLSELNNMYKIAAEKAKNNVFSQILAKKAKKSDFFLDIYFKSTIIRR